MQRGGFARSKRKLLVDVSAIPARHKGICPRRAVR